MKKNFYSNGQAYGSASPEGGPLKLCRIEQIGHLVLAKVLNDGNPYWFVRIMNFEFTSLKSIAKYATPKIPGDRQKLLIDPLKNGTWRFTDLKRAQRKFRSLTAIPVVIADEKKRQKLSEERRARLIDSGLGFQKKAPIGEITQSVNN